MNKRNQYAVACMAIIIGIMILAVATQQPQQQTQPKYVCETIAVANPAGLPTTVSINPQCQIYNIAGKIRQCCPKVIK